MKDAVELYPLVSFVERGHTDDMDKECALFLHQLKKWL
jgi:hypothetical protein